MDPEPPCTLTGLAAALGIDKSTVHRALNGSPLVAPATRERVLAAAAKAGYRRDPYFSALVAHRRKSGNTTLPVHFLHGSPVNPDFRQGCDCLDHLREQGRQRGFDVQAADMSSFPKWSAMLRVLYSRGCRGLLIEQVDPIMHDMLRHFDRLPMVCCERQENLPFHTVRYAVGDRVRLCWRKLREAGHRRIGFVLYSHATLLNDDRDRMGAALMLLHRTPPRERIPILEVNTLGEPASYPAWLSRHRPEAVISFNPGLWYAGRDHPRRPRAFTTLHADAGNIDTRHVPGAIHAHQIFAREAIALLDRAIRLGEVGMPELPIDVVIPPLWHEGDGISPSA